MTRVWALFLLGGKGSAKMKQNSVQHNATGELMRGQSIFRFVKQNLKFSYYHILTVLAMVVEDGNFFKLNFLSMLI
jgi:hypothetical protein